MTTNVGTIDRVLRIILALVFAGLYFSGTVTGTPGLVLVILGAVFLLTGLLGWCGLYAMFGMSTCPMKK